MGGIRKLVLDVVKPQEPNIIEYAKQLSDLEGIMGVNVGLLEIDKKVENVRINIEGKNIDVNKVFELIENLGGAVHSIDEVSAGSKMVKHATTLEEM